MSSDHLTTPPKPKASPLDFRNTDLVSRLLAATPPYLYNMSLLPNTYFFSEMLRSFVQAKSEHNLRAPSTIPHPQSRRSRKRTWSSTRTDYFQRPSKPPAEKEADWMLKSNKAQERKLEENPLELTNKPVADRILCNKIETKTEPLQEPSVMGQNLQPQDLVLPPPPPMWYPPIYPTAPYGIDPLHFFIDLRVSGHIYDRKNHKEVNVPSYSSPKEKLKEEENPCRDLFKQNRHSSAFSVPVPSNKAVNLSGESKMTKFDVKSMGFDKSSNKTGTNYILGNIGEIYRSVGSGQEEVKVEDWGSNQEEEDKEKKVKDLRELIGLELVVDYVSKPEETQTINSSDSTDVESVGSPTLEVVDN